MAAVPNHHQNDKKHEDIEKNAELKEYRTVGEEVKMELDRLLSTTDKFTTSSDTYSEFKIQGKSFKIQTVVSYSSDTKHKKNPLIWYTETVCPGAPAVIYESWTDSNYRMEWDSNLSNSERIHIDDAVPNLYILHSSTNAAAGGLISPRDFVDLLSVFEDSNEETGCQSIQIASKSIQRKDVPKQKGFERGTVVISGVFMERLGNDEMQKLKLPKLLLRLDSDDNEEEEKKTTTKECEWTRIRYIVQTDIKGWIPASVINAAMAHTNKGMMRDLRNFVIRQRLELYDVQQ